MLHIIPNNFMFFTDQLVIFKNLLFCLKVKNRIF